MACTRKGSIITMSCHGFCNNYSTVPFNFLRWYWDVLVVLLLLFTVTILPISIAFYSNDQLKPEWLTVNIIVDTLFLTDIVVNFRTGLMVDETESVS